MRLPKIDPGADEARTARSLCESFALLLLLVRKCVFKDEVEICHTREMMKFAIEVCEVQRRGGRFFVVPGQQGTVLERKRWFSYL